MRPLTGAVPLLLSALLLLPVSPASGQEAPWGSCLLAAPDTGRAVARQSRYLQMDDGIRLAADVFLPAGLEPDRRLPTVLIATRYWRAAEGQPAGDFEQAMIRHGYAVVQVDVRGTGASFGTWRYPWSPREVDDLGAVVRWIGEQPWSDGTVGTIGTSYLANTAQLAAAAVSPGLKAVMPKFMDFDGWTDLVAPGGVVNRFLLETWGEVIHSLDMNQSPGGGPLGVRRVDEDRDGSGLAAAVRDHAANPRLDEATRSLVFRDDSIPQWEATVGKVDTHRWRVPIERAKTPIFGWASWFDAGTANGVLHRWVSWSNPQVVVIGAWSHGARHDASPFREAGAEPSPGRAVQDLAAVCWFDLHLRGNPNDLRKRRIYYYTIGEERWKSTDVWPVPGTTRERWYLGPSGGLAPRQPAAGSDRYPVDFEATTGTTNRWYTQMGGGDVIYPDRREADRRLITYTSAPLSRDMEVTGHAEAVLRLATTATDGHFFVYLEDVAPDGRVTYVTEGMLRGIHRRLSSDSPPYSQLVPFRTYLRKDAMPLVPGEATELRFALFPTSVLFRKGHRIRVALAGADKDTFGRLPAAGEVEWTVSHGGRAGSYLELPVAPR
jgi:hypothetical protein